MRTTSPSAWARGMNHHASLRSVSPKRWVWPSPRWALGIEAMSGAPGCVLSLRVGAGPPNVPPRKSLRHLAHQRLRGLLAERAPRELEHVERARSGRRDERDAVARAHDVARLHARYVQVRRT